MRRTTLLLVATAAAMLWATAALAQTLPQGDLDANCLVSSDGGLLLNTDEQAAQTFTAVNSGKLTSAQVEIIHQPVLHGYGDYILKIATVDSSSGAPTTNVLASAEIDDSSLPSDRQMITANFAPESAAQVVAGQKYALIVARENAILWVTARDDNPCSGGSTYSSTAGGPFTQPDGNRDLIYATYVTPPPPPNNDAFANTQTISGSNASFYGTTDEATRQIGEPDHYTSGTDSAWIGDHSVWYSWKAPASGSTTIDTCQANIDSILAVYTGSQLSSLSRVADNNNGCSSGWGSKVVFNAAAGTTYRIVVADAGGARESTFSLGLAAPTDTIAPKVKRVVPAEDATDIGPGTNVSAFFSEAMRKGYINTDTFKLYKKGTTIALPAAVSYDAVARKAILNPDANLKRGATYKAVVTIEARDLADNQLDQKSTLSDNQPKTWFFTVKN